MLLIELRLALGLEPLFVEHVVSFVIMRRLLRCSLVNTRMVHVVDNSIIAEREDSYIVLTSEYRDKDLIKTVPGTRWKRDVKRWELQLSWTACVQLRGTFGNRLAVGERLAAWSQMEAERIWSTVDLRDALDADGVDEPALMGFQRAGVAFLAAARQAVCGDEMGVGKTTQTIKTLERTNAYPAIIVATKSAMENWRREFAKADLGAPDREVRVVTGGVKRRRELLEPGADVYIVHWGLLRYHSRLAGYGNINLSDEEKTEKELNRLGHRAFIADEAHRMQDPKSKQTRAAWWLADQAGPDGVKLALTGTPVANKIDTFWPLLRAVAPHEWPSRAAFLDRYALLSWNPWGGMDIAGVKPETRDEFHDLIAPRFIRRPKSAVLPDLPPKVYPAPRAIELRKKQRKAYDAMRQEMLAQLDDGEVVMASNPLARLTRLVQFASAYAEVDDNGDLKLAEPSATLDELDELLGELGGEPALVFAQSRQLIELAAARLAKRHVPHGLITGAIPEDQRQATQDHFQSGAYAALLLTLGAGGESLTLTRAKTVIFLQRPWSLIQNRQAEDRAHRIGQQNSVAVIDIVPEDTVMARIHEALVAKEQSLEEVVNDEGTIRRLLA